MNIVASRARPLALAMAASLSLARIDATASDVAYAEVAAQSGWEYVRIDFGTGTTEDIGPLSQLLMAGAFVGGDFSKEYVIDYPNADLYSIDVFTADTTLIGSVAAGIIGQVPTGFHWDPASTQTFLMAANGSCNSSTLYRLDVSDASTVEVGSSATCTVSLAIDSQGDAYGIDLLSDTLVSIDTTTGAAAPVGPLGFRASFVGAFDFDPATGILYLIAYDLDTLVYGFYVVDTATGGATFISPETNTYYAFAFAPNIDPIFVNGFDGQLGTPMP